MTDLRNFSPAFDDEPGNTQDFVGLSPGSRISEEQFAAAGLAANQITPEQDALVKKEILRQLSQIEPIYKQVLKLREFVSKQLIKGVREAGEPQSGFHADTKEPLNISELTKRIEQTIQFLNFHYEDMQGMATQITSGIKMMSMALQTDLIGFAFKLKRFGSEIDRSSEPEFYEDLRMFNFTLAQQEISIEASRGKIK